MRSRGCCCRRTTHGRAGPGSAWNRLARHAHPDVGRRSASVWPLGIARLRCLTPRGGSSSLRPRSRAGGRAGPCRGRRRARTGGVGGCSGQDGGGHRRRTGRHGASAGRKAEGRRRHLMSIMATTSHNAYYVKRWRTCAVACRSTGTTTAGALPRQPCLRRAGAFSDRARGSRWPSEWPAARESTRSSRRSARCWPRCRNRPSPRPGMR